MQQNEADAMNRIDAQIEQVTKIVEKAQVFHCEVVKGYTSLDPGEGQPCGKRGEFREDMGIVMCERCYKDLQ